MLSYFSICDKQQEVSNREIEKACSSCEFALQLFGNAD